MWNLRDQIDAWLRGAIAPPPIVRTLGIRLVAFSDGAAEAEMPVTPELWNAMGTLHGGVFADLADVTMGVALAASTTEGESFTSTTLGVSFFVAVRSGLLRARATVIRRGRSSGYAECTIENEAGDLVAKASSLCLFQSRS